MPVLVYIHKYHSAIVPPHNVINDNHMYNLYISAFEIIFIYVKNLWLRLCSQKIRL